MMLLAERTKVSELIIGATVAHHHHDLTTMTHTSAIVSFQRRFDRHASTENTSIYHPRRHLLCCGNGICCGLDISQSIQRPSPTIRFVASHADQRSETRGKGPVRRMRCVRCSRNDLRRICRSYTNTDLMANCFPLAGFGADAHGQNPTKAAGTNEPKL